MGGQHGLRELATKAPDFLAWRSGVFDFRSEQFEQSAIAMQATFGEEFVFQDRGDLERKLSLYQGLLEEQGRQDAPDEAFVARLSTRISMAFRVLGRLKEAEDQALQALETFRHIGDRAGEAEALECLGVAQVEMGRLEDAEKSLGDSMEIREGMGDIPRLAGNYHKLGIILGERGRLDEAEEWYRKSLEIWERLGQEQGAAAGYHHMGRVAHTRQRLDEAEEWYRKSLEIRERVGNQLEMVITLAQMGVLHGQQNRDPEAVSLFGRALAIATEHEMRVGGRVLLGLATVAQDMGKDEFASAWRDAFDGQEPPMKEIREAAETMESDEDATASEPTP